MRGVKTAAILAGVLMMFSSMAFAGADTDCAQGAACKLSDAGVQQFSTMSYPDGQAPFKAQKEGGKVDGVAVRRDGDKVIDVMFVTPLGCAAEPRVWDVAICGAEEVTHRLWENNKWADKEVLVPTGKYANCDNFQLKTNCGYDAMHATVKNNQLRIHVAEDGKDDGGLYTVYVADTHIPARKNWYHFIVK